MTLSCNFYELLDLPYLFPGSVCVQCMSAGVQRSRPGHVVSHWSRIWSLDTGGGGLVTGGHWVAGHGSLELPWPAAKWWEDDITCFMCLTDSACHVLSVQQETGHCF